MIDFPKKKKIRDETVTLLNMLGTFCANDTCKINNKGKTEYVVKINNKEKKQNMCSLNQSHHVLKKFRFL